MSDCENIINIDEVKELAKKIPINKYIVIEPICSFLGKSDNYWVNAKYNADNFYFSVFNSLAGRPFLKKEKVICFFEMSPSGFLACKDSIKYTEMREKYLLSSQVKRSPTSNAQLALSIQQQNKILEKISKDIFEIKKTMEQTK